MKLNGKQLGIVLAGAIVMVALAVLTVVVPFIRGGLQAFIVLWIGTMTGAAGLVIFYADENYEVTRRARRFAVRMVGAVVMLAILLGVVVMAWRMMVVWRW